jgi:hypothetical protein
VRLYLFWDVYVHLGIHVVRQDYGLIRVMFLDLSEVGMSRIEGVAWAARLRDSPLSRCEYARTRRDAC